MSSEHLKQVLETRKGSMSEQEFFELILDMLENCEDQDTREILESYLIMYSYIDKDRVARYLEQFLFDLDPYRMMFAILELNKLAKIEGSLAEKILIKFSEGRSTEFEHFLEEPSLSEETKNRELEQYLEERRKNLTKEEFFELVLGMLQKDPPKETRNVLKKYLLVYSFVDKDRVARYLEQFLSDTDPFERELVALDLALLARKPNSLASRILANYLGGELTEDERTKIMMERLIKLFPYGTDEENQP